jgi:hypothetical protein
MIEIDLHHKAQELNISFNDLKTIVYKLEELLVAHNQAADIDTKDVLKNQLGEYMISIAVPNIYNQKLLEFLESLLRQYLVL